MEPSIKSRSSLFQKKIASSASIGDGTIAPCRLCSIRQHLCHENISAPTSIELQTPNFEAFLTSVLNIVSAKLTLRWMDALRTCSASSGVDVGLKSLELLLLVVRMLLVVGPGAPSFLVPSSDALCSY